MVYIVILVAVAAIFMGVASERSSRGEASESGFSPSNNGAAPVVLKEQRGGYSKSAVLAKLDAYNSLLVSIEDGGVGYTEAVKTLDEVRAIPMTTVNGVGFSVPDVDSYIAGLEKKIEEKLETLK